MTVKPMVGVVTVTYNSGRFIDDFMESMLAQSFDNFILYVIDNVSGDDTLARLERYHDPRVRLTANPTNTGISGGNNQGIREALADGCSHVLLINNDTTFGPELLQLMLDGLSENACDITVSKMMYHDDKNLIWFAGGYFKKTKFLFNEHVGMNRVDDGSYDQARPIDYAPTCCMLLESRVFSVVGLMDEKYFVYYDDVDFCYRARKKGVKMMYLPEAVLYHKVSSSTGGEYTDFSVRYGNRNRVYFLCKNVPFLKLLAPVYVMLSCLKQLVLGRYDLKKFGIALEAIGQGYRMTSGGAENR